MIFPPSLRAAAITAPLVFLPPAIAGALEYSPHRLVLEFSNGHQEHIAATSLPVCEQAARAIRTGLWHRRRASRGRQLPHRQPFSERSLCIPSFNCPPEVR